MTFSKHLAIIVKRNLILKKKSWFFIIIEILAPIVFFLMQSGSRIFIKPNLIPEERYQPIEYISNIDTFLYHPYNPYYKNNFLYYAPINEHTNFIMNFVKNNTNYPENIIGLKSISDLNNFKHNDSFWAGVIFENANFSLNFNPTVTIRVSSQSLPPTSEVFNPSVDNYTTCKSFQQYKDFSGFIPLQHIISKAFIFISDKNFTFYPFFQLFPVQEHFINNNSDIFIVVDSLYLIMGFNLILIFLSYKLIYDKENLFLQQLTLKSVSEFVYFLSWFLIYSIINIFSSTSFFLFVYFLKYNENILLHGPTLFFSLFFYAQSLIGIAFIFYHILSNVKSVSSLFALTILTMSPGFLFMITSIPMIIELLLCLLFSPISLTLCMVSIAYPQYTSFNPLAYLFFLLFNNFFYYFIFWFISMVNTNRIGGPYPLNFLCSSSYWQNIDQNGDNTSNIQLDESNNKDFEQVDDSFPKLFQSTNLCKMYETGWKIMKTKKTITALDHLNMEIYSNQITALLGHNGAGKSTFISILNGLTNITSGSFSYNQQPYPKGFKSLVSNIGVCHQKDYLQDYMTVQEHMEFFSKLSNIPEEDIQTSIVQILTSVGLPNKNHFNAFDLSGGEKRKLSVAIALIGNPKVIVLDEPTSGMDPESARKIWNLLRNLKQNNSVVIFSTHNMYEADIVADRIIILNKGHIRCAGSSLFLKSRFGSGYHLNFEMDESITHSNIDIDPHHNVVEKLTHCISKYIDGFSFSFTTNDIISFTLPLNQVHNFSGLFKQFNQNLQDYNILSYSVELSNLEEVFIKLSEDFEDNETNNKIKSVVGEVKEKKDIDSETIIAQPFSKNENLNIGLITDPPLPIIIDHFLQFKANIIKRLLFVTRDSDVFTQQIIQPIIYTIILIFMVGAFSHNSENIALNLNDKTIFDSQKTLFTSPSLIHNETQTFLSSIFKEIQYFPSENSLIDYQLNSLNPLAHRFAFHFYNLTNELLYAVNKVNCSDYHGTAFIYNSLINAILFSFNSSINFINHPIETESNFNEAFLISNMMSAIFAGTALTFVTMVSAMNLTKERQSKIKDMMFSMSLQPYVYWISNLLVDFFLFFITIFICYIIFAIGNIEIFLGANFFPTLLIFSLYALSSFSFIYFVCYSSSSVPLTVFLCVIVNILIPMAIFMLSLFIPEFRTTDIVSLSTFTIFFGLIPGAGLFLCLYQYSFLYSMSSIPFLRENIPSIWDLNQIGGILLIMTIDCIIYLGICILFDSNKIQCQCRSDPPIQSESEATDQDIIDEQTRLLSKEYNTDPVSWNGVSKTFYNMDDDSSIRALNNLTLGVELNQCLGCLGPNGAGKTTALQILLNRIHPTAGFTKVHSYQSFSFNNKMFTLLGYCPQTDDLMENLTVYEHFSIFGMIKGIQKTQLKEVITVSLESFNLQDFSDIRTKYLSGGTKRRLTAALAVFTRPHIIVLDEPTSGIDPQNRRYIWDTLKAARNGRVTLLTTHSMEEADAISTKIAIIVNGQLKCLGSSQHLKNKFGKGYEIEVHTEHEIISEVLNVIKSKYPGIIVNEESDGHIKLSFFPPNDLQSSHKNSLNFSYLADMFEFFEEKRHSLKIKEYCISQPSLEGIFLQFARNQHNIY